MLSPVRLVVLALAMWVSLAPAQAETSITLTHQGRLLGLDDRPVTTPVELGFGLFATAEPNDDETPLWSSDWIAVTPQDGAYAFTFEVPRRAFLGFEPRYLEVRLRPDLVLRPRQRLGQAPSAAVSGDSHTVNGLEASTSARPGVLLALDAEGRFPISTLPDAVVRTGPDGRFEASALPADVVRVDAAGYLPVGSLPPDVLRADADGLLPPDYLPPDVARTQAGRLDAAVLPVDVVRTTGGKIALDVVPDALVRAGADGRVGFAALPSSISQAWTAPTASPGSPATLAAGGTLTLNHPFSSAAIGVDLWVSLDDGATYKLLPGAGRVSPFDFGDGSDGDLAVSGDLVIDAARTTASGVAGGSVLTVGSATGFAAGHRALLVQMQGSGAGDWEEVRIASVGTTTVNLTSPLGSTFVNAGAQHAQLVRMPQYRQVTVGPNATLTAPVWNGQVGGVLAFRVSATLVVDAKGRLDVSGLGFRGGVATTNAANAADVNGLAGESEAGAGARGGLANASGGGGGCGQAGGAGAGHLGPGVAGIVSGTCSTSCTGPSGQLGSLALDLVPRMLPGSGGGSSGLAPVRCGNGNLGGTGGAGGGILRVLARTIQAQGQFSANGAAGTVGCQSPQSGTIVPQNGGGGGGGAGGTVWISGDQVSLPTASILAQGGAGGTGSTGSGTTCGNGGAGGAGSHGRVRLEYARLVTAPLVSAPKPEVEALVGTNLADVITIQQSVAQPGQVLVRNDSKVAVKVIAVVRQ